MKIFGDLQYGPSIGIEAAIETQGSKDPRYCRPPKNDGWREVV